MGAKKILIIDDDHDVRLGLTVRLKASGYETAIAGDAITAISQARRVGPDLILLDLGLPGGDGFVVMKRLRSIHPLSCVPIIVLSARDPVKNQEWALKEGAQDYFQKPADNEALLAAIRRALGDNGGA